MNEGIGSIGKDKKTLHSERQEANCEGYNVDEQLVSNILVEAERIVEGSRQIEYGDKRECFSRIAAMWSGYLGVDVTAFDVVNLMIVLKVCRTHDKGFQRESYIDMAGYAYCAEIMNKSILAEKENF